jgi:hypothetical protein
MVFDNFGNQISPEGRTRVIEFDPTNMDIVWEYKGTADHPLETLIRGSDERLANGNTLITETGAGRIFEVTPEGKIVWEYMNPIRAGDNDSLIPIICWAHRIDDQTVAAALGNEAPSPTVTALETSP